MGHQLLEVVYLVASQLRQLLVVSGPLLQMHLHLLEHLPQMLLVVAQVSTNVNNGTAAKQFTPFTEKDSANMTNVFQNICCMPEYKNFSFEELRLKDYEQGRRFPPAGATANAGFGGAAGTNATGGFGFSGAATGASPFGSGTVGAANPSGSALGLLLDQLLATSQLGPLHLGCFYNRCIWRYKSEPVTFWFQYSRNFGSGASNTFGGGANSTFGKPATGFGSSGGAFGGNTNTGGAGGGLFGSSGNAFGGQSSSGFGAANNSSPFGQAQSNNAFGGANNNSPFGQSNTQQQSGVIWKWDW